MKKNDGFFCYRYEEFFLNLAPGVLPLEHYIAWVPTWEYYGDITDVTFCMN